MNLQTPKFSTQLPSSRPLELVFACAWCPPNTYRKLFKNQDYTHGICYKHKSELLAKFKDRIIH
jgi:hypothetical protein